MTRRTKKATPAAVTWLSDQVMDPNCLSSSFQHYQKFRFQNLIAEIDDFVLISNADAAEPDTEEGCDAARIVSLYEDSTNQNDPYRAKVQWYSRPNDLPSSCFSNMEPVDFLDKEVIEDHRPFNCDVSIETFFKKCSISFAHTKDTEYFVQAPYHYICRYRLMSLSKRKVYIEPVMEEERKAIQLLCTPAKSTTSPRMAKTPTSLVKGMSRVSLSEQRNWSVSKTEGTKLLLKRAILADKTEKDSPMTPKTPSRRPSVAELPSRRPSVAESPQTPSRRPSVAELRKTLSRRSSVAESPRTPSRRLSVAKLRKTPSRRPSVAESPPTPSRRPSIAEPRKTPSRRPSIAEPRKTPSRRISVAKTPKSTKKLIKNNLEDILSMELKETSDDELPTLIIRQNLPTTPKRKQSIPKTNNETPKKALIREDDEEITYSTRSGRATKNKVYYVEEEISPVKRTPRRTKRISESECEWIDDTDTANPEVENTPKRTRRVTESDEEFEPAPRTPKTSRTPRTPRNAALTPKQKVSRKIISQLTPTLHTRANSVDHIEEFGKDSKSLPGRESQMEEILSFVRSKLIKGVSGCMYISGVPGTGKTATVCSALSILKQESDLPEFNLVEVNGMRIAEPRQAYVQIYKQLTGKSVVWEQACSLLEKRFTNPGPRRTPTVLLVDELDALCTRRQDVLYSIMEWAAHNTALLTVLAVANTMDLPERALAARVASRLGLTRLVFQPYTHSQLQTIVATRLAGANVTPDAVLLIARKVAAVSGDARRALALCARALELAGAGRAGLREVQRALDEAASGATVTAIRRCSPAERLMLRAVAAEVERTGSDETTLSRALCTAAAIVSLDGRPYRAAAHTRAPTPSQALAACARLAALRLLLLKPTPAEPGLLLNVSADDVHYATKQITV